MFNDTYFVTTGIDKDKDTNDLNSEAENLKDDLKMYDNEELNYMKNIIKTYLLYELSSDMDVMISLRTFATNENTDENSFNVTENLKVQLKNSALNNFIKEDSLITWKEFINDYVKIYGSPEEVSQMKKNCWEVFLDSVVKFNKKLKYFLIYYEKIFEKPYPNKYSLIS